MHRLRPHRPQILAGTVPCPDCQGHPLIRRHTANLEKAFNLEEPWQFAVRPCYHSPCLGSPCSAFAFPHLASGRPCLSLAICIAAICSRGCTMLIYRLSIEKRSIQSSR